MEADMPVDIILERGGNERKLIPTSVEDLGFRKTWIYDVDRSLVNKLRACAYESGSSATCRASVVCPLSGNQICPNKVSHQQNEMVLRFDFGLGEEFITIAATTHELFIQSNIMRYSEGRLELITTGLLPHASFDMLSWPSPPSVIKQYRLAIEACRRRLNRHGNRAYYGNVPGTGIRSRRRAHKQRLAS